MVERNVAMSREWVRRDAIRNGPLEGVLQGGGGGSGGTPSRKDCGKDGCKEEVVGPEGHRQGRTIEWTVVRRRGWVRWDAGESGWTS